ncbi:MAG: MbcA/ParS/Xre antitoxin family protein [Dehalococcoidia bacterium]
MRVPAHSLRSRFTEFFASRGRSSDGASAELRARVKAVQQHALEVFGDAAVARTWLSRPNRALLNQRPNSLLMSPEGIEQVDDVLTRIEHGVIS